MSGSFPFSLQHLLTSHRLAACFWHEGPRQGDAGRSRRQAGRQSAVTRPALSYPLGSQVLSRGDYVSRGLGHTKNVCCTPTQHTPGKQTVSDFLTVASIRDYSVDRPSQEEERKVCAHGHPLSQVLRLLPGRCTNPPPQTLHARMHTPHTHTPTRGISRALQLVMSGFGAKPHTKHRRQGPSPYSPPLMMIFTGLFFFNFVGGLEMKSLRDTSKQSSRAPTCTCFETSAGAL